MLENVDPFTMSFNLESKLHEMEEEIKQGIIEERLFHNFIGEHYVTDGPLYIRRDETDFEIEKVGRDTYARIQPLKIEYPPFPTFSRSYPGDWENYARPNGVIFHLNSISHNVVKWEHQIVVQTLLQDLREYPIDSLDYQALIPAINEVIGIKYPDILLLNPRQLFGNTTIEGFIPHWQMHHETLEKKGRNFYGQIGLLQLYWSSQIPLNEGLLYNRRNALVKSSEIEVEFDDYEHPRMFRVRERILGWMEDRRASLKIILPE